MQPELHRQTVGVFHNSTCRSPYQSLKLVHVNTVKYNRKRCHATLNIVINIDLTVPNVSYTCLPITIVSSLNTQAASTLLMNKTYISNITYVWIYLMVSEVVGICLNIVWTTLTIFW